MQLPGTSTSASTYKVRLIASCLLAVSIFGCSSGSSTGDQQFLARVEVPDYLEDLNLPVYADFEDAQGTYHAFVKATKAQMDRAGVNYLVIDEYQSGTLYLIALEEVSGARKEAAALAKILYDDGEHIIVRYHPDLSELLPDMGFDLKLMSETPINHTRNGLNPVVKAVASAGLFNTDKNTKVEAMLNAVTEANIRVATEQLSGEREVTVDGAPYTFVTRHTSSGVPIQKATQYVYDRLVEMGVDASFAQWTFSYEGETLANRNVVGEIKGQTTPDQIVILIAHLDSISKGTDGIVPGADDNASGCVALLTAAGIMKGYKFQRTVRFVFTTGEEQSLFGGRAYAKKVKDEGKQIVAVLNLDMIGYSKVLTPPVKPKQQIKTRNIKNQTGYEMDMRIAQAYVDVVKNYGMDQVFEAVMVDDGEQASDHSPFWDLKDYPAAWAIEYAEAGYLNPNMHSSKDRVDISDQPYMNLPYYAAVVKAALGTVAHMAVPAE